MIFNPVFIQALSAFYIGVYLLYSDETLCLFEPKRLYEPCFYTDKYNNYSDASAYNLVNFAKKSGEIQCKLPAT